MNGNKFKNYHDVMLNLFQHRKVVRKCDPETSSGRRRWVAKSFCAQNLVEFVFILPILLFITLVIFEVALFWQDVNSIYNLNAEINANIALESNSNLNIGDTCPAATEAVTILKKKQSMISLNDPTYTKNILDGSEPFALYNYTANPITVGGVTKPQIALWVDCRNPFENGVTTQIEFYHKTLIMKASIPRFDGGDAITIIPDHIFIASPKLNTVKQY